MILDQKRSEWKMSFLSVQISPEWIHGLPVAVQLLRSVGEETPKRFHPEDDDLGFSGWQIALGGKYCKAIGTLHRYLPYNRTVMVRVDKMNKMPAVKSRFEWVAIIKWITAVAVVVVRSDSFLDVLFPVLHFVRFIVKVFVPAGVVVQLKEKQILQEIQRRGTVLLCIYRPVERRGF
jgi:hypothetical protein